MKRSKVAGLALMGAAPFVLTACDEPPSSPPEAAYTSVAECVEGELFTAEACEAQWERARLAHLQQAPKFDERSACEAEFGADACEPVRAEDGSSWFMPAMAGYLIGQALNDRGYYGGYYRGKPLYRDRYDRGRWRTADNQTVLGRDDLNRKYGQAITNTRGGFGSQAAARGGWGS